MILSQIVKNELFINTLLKKIYLKMKKIIIKFVFSNNRQGIFFLNAQF